MGAEIEIPTTDNQVKQKKAKKGCKLTKTTMLIIIIVMTSSFFLVELIVGHITKSNALTADAFHMLSDLIALIIGLIAVRFSKKSSSDKNTFGWARAEILGSIFNCVFLLALCFTIVVEAINRFVEPEPLKNVELMLGVGGAGLALNIVSLLLFWIQEKCAVSDDDDDDEDKDEEVSPTSYDNKAAEFDDVVNSGGDNKNTRHSKKEKKKANSNMNMRAVFLNALGDSLGSVAVVVSGLLVLFVPPKGFENAKWKEYVDPVLSLIIATIIIITVIPLLIKSSMIILQTVPSELDFSQIKDQIKSVRGVTDVHHFHVWSLNPEKLVASAHIRVDGDTNDEDNWKIVNSVKKILHSNNVHSTTIQLEDDTVSLDSCDISMCPKDSKCCDQTPNAIKIDKVDNPITKF